MGVNEFIQIGSRIKKLRIEKGMSQKEMAKRCEIPYSTYSNYENNNREPSSEQLRKISDVLGVTTQELISDIEDIKYKVLLRLAEARLIDTELISNLSDIDRNVAVEISLQSVLDDIENRTKSKDNKINFLFDSLNEIGQNKAIEQMELLTKIPEYRKEPDPDTPDK